MMRTHNWLDAAIGWIAPRTALERVQARRRLVGLQTVAGMGGRGVVGGQVHHQRAWEGASRGDGWHPRRAGASATADYMADARELRHRARSLAANVPYIAQALNVMVSCTVGQGIAPRWLMDTMQPLAGVGTAAVQRAQRLWQQWSACADYDGLLDFYGLQAKAWLALKTDGEVLVRLHVSPQRHSGYGATVVPLRLQLLEIDWLDIHKNASARAASGGQAGHGDIVAGIEYAADGKRVAYWLFNRHPGDMASFKTAGGLGASVRVAAEEIIHLFNPARPGQQAGITALAPVIAAVRDLQVYEDAEQARKNLETRMGIIGEWHEDLIQSGIEIPASARSESGSAAATLHLGELAGGAALALPPGMRNPTFIQPAAVPGYVDYVKHRQKIIAAGLGVPYEYMTGDLSEVNFSSSRVRTNLYKKDVEREQWTILVPIFCQRVAVRWLQLASLVDEGLAALAEGTLTADWTTPRWASVNPQQDVAADIAEIRAGLCSVSEKIRQRGYDPEIVYRELKQDIERLKSDGTLEALVQWLK